MTQNRAYNEDAKFTKKESGKKIKLIPNQISIATISLRRNIILHISLSEIPTRIEFRGMQYNLLFQVNLGSNHDTT